MTKPRFPWTPEEAALAARIYAESIAKDDRRSEASRAIMAATGRTEGTVSIRFYRCGPSFDGGKSSRVQIPETERPTMGSLRLSEQMIADRDARKAATELRDYTQEFFGDPPPGFSALDEYRRRQARGSDDSRPVISVAATVAQLRSDYR